MGGPLNALEVCDNERGVLEKSVDWKCVGKSTRKGNKDKKSGGDVEPQVVSGRVS